MSYGVRQFLLNHLDRLQLRIGQLISELTHAPVPAENVAKALHMATALTKSKGDQPRPPQESSAISRRLVSP